MTQAAGKLPRVALIVVAMSVIHAVATTTLAQSAPVTPGTSPSAAPKAAGAAPAKSGSAERRYPVSNQGDFVLQVPRDWKDQVRRLTSSAPSTIVFTPASGDDFTLVVTPSPPTLKRPTALTREEMRAGVERSAKGAKAWAVETELPIREFQGRASTGFYISATERVAKAGTHKFITTGVLRVGELSVPFTITSHERGAVVQRALDVLKSAAQVPSVPAKR